MKNRVSQNIIKKSRLIIFLVFIFIAVMALSTPIFLKKFRETPKQNKTSVSDTSNQSAVAKNTANHILSI